MSLFKRLHILLMAGLSVCTMSLIATLLVPQFPVWATLTGFAVGVIMAILAGVRASTPQNLALAESMTIYFVRHGHTENLDTQVYQTRTDVPLSDVGREIAGRLSIRFSDIQLSAVYTSTLSRTIDTARIICGEIYPTVPICQRVELQEIDVGYWEGLSHKEVDRVYPGMRLKRQHNPGAIVPPGGENLSTAQRRVKRFIDALRAAHPDGGTLLIVSHQSIMGLMMAMILGCPPGLHRRFLMKPCGVAKIKIVDGSPAFEFYDDTLHEILASKVQLQALGFARTL